MYKNFIRIASANIKTKLLNVNENLAEIKKYLQFAFEKKIDIVIFSELTLTGLSAGQMITSREVYSNIISALEELKIYSKNYNTLFVVGAPIMLQGNAFNALLAFQNGEIKGIKLKNSINYEESKYFSKNNLSNLDILIGNKKYDCSSDLIFSDANNRFSINILFEDESLLQNLNNASINLIAGNSHSIASNLKSKSNNFQALSKLSKNAIVYAGPSSFESSSNYSYSADKFIIEDGKILEVGKSYTNGLIYSEVNIDCLKSRLSNSISINFSNEEFIFRRKIDKYPYMPDKNNWNSFMQNILDIQSHALARRLSKLPDKKIFLGLSGGLDSTLALIVSKYTFELLNLDLKNIHAITMPGLGTSERTKNNALELAKAYGVSIEEISIKESVLQHFKDIKHDENIYDSTFENSQARERTQILMDLTNKYGGLVLGTGNMSEIALGWATYNGDHISMYAINSGIPKTLLREIVRFVKNNSDNAIIEETLSDIIDTPISPELLPTNNDGNISQKTEDNIGPYELHDFYLYHLVRNNSSYEDIKYMAKLAFKEKYSDEEIEKWFNKFISRFISQQFKRNVSVDAPMILDYSLNPKFGFTMPSDI